MANPRIPKPHVVTPLSLEITTASGVLLWITFPMQALKDLCLQMESDQRPFACQTNVNTATQNAMTINKYINKSVIFFVKPISTPLV